MAARELTNKPLVESIFEVRWELSQSRNGLSHDPHYKLLLGRLFDRVTNAYPSYEELPTASLPDEMVGYAVQHRFRTAESAWPLIQVGPGVMTVNSTADYRWSDFRPRAVNAVAWLFDAHPKVEELRVTQLNLRYINAVTFDYREGNAYTFLRDKMRVNVSLPESLFVDTGVENIPKEFQWQSTFPCKQPFGQMHIKFATGQKLGEPALVWESAVHSKGERLPSMPIGFAAWLDLAHELIDDWFFKLIEGELQREFSND